MARSYKLVPVICLAMCWLSLSFTSQASKTVIYPKQGVSDDKTGYPLALLRLALDRAVKEDEILLIASQIEIPQSRILKLIANNVVIDIGWSMTSKEREASLLPVKIPLYKGLYGYRVLLIQEGEQHLFPKNLTTEVFKTQRIGVQGHDWPDTKILRHNGFNITQGTNYLGMFQMLKKGRVQYFPRSVLEVWSELESPDSSGLVVEKNFLIRYPTAMYYFVNPKKQWLAKAVEQGLYQAKEDGSFDLLFESIQQDFVERANFDQRTILELDNPF